MNEAVTKALYLAEEPSVHLTTRSRILAAAAATFFFVLVLELIRRRRLQERYTVLWFVLAVGMLAGALFPTLLELLAKGLGVRDTNIALFAVLLLLLLALAFESTITASRQGERITRLAQENALLRMRVSPTRPKDPIEGGTEGEQGSPPATEPPG